MYMYVVHFVCVYMHMYNVHVFCTISTVKWGNLDGRQLGTKLDQECGLLYTMYMYVHVYALLHIIIICVGPHLVLGSSWTISPSHSALYDSERMCVYKQKRKKNTCDSCRSVGVKQILFFLNVIAAHTCTCIYIYIYIYICLTTYQHFVQHSPLTPAD